MFKFFVTRSAKLVVTQVSETELIIHHVTESCGGYLFNVSENASTQWEGLFFVRALDLWGLQVGGSQEGVHGPSKQVDPIKQ